MIHVVYHKNCDDGFGAALAASSALDSNYASIQYYPAKYDDAPIEVNEGDAVYILDFSYPVEVVKRMAETCTVILLDHHLTAARAWGMAADASHHSVQLPNHGSVYFDMTHSGAVLAWQFFHHREAPLFYQYLEARDLWQQHRFTGVDEFYYALRSYPRKFSVWQELVERWSVGALIDDGKIIKRYFLQQLDDILRDNPAAKLTLEYVHPELRMMQKVTGLTLNESKLFSSELGHELAVKSGTFGASWRADGKNTYVSLRSDSPECNVGYIAQSYGGGGYARAAGFNMPLVSFLKHLS